MAASEREEKPLNELDEPGVASQREPPVLDELDAPDDDDDDDPRPTVVPAFDVEKYAKTADEFSEVRARMATVTDEAALDAALEESRKAGKSDEALTAPPPPPDHAADGEPALADSRVIAKAGRAADAEVEVGVAHVELGDLGELDVDEQIAILRDRLGPLTRVPRLSRPVTELGELVEDSRTAFAIGFIDGLLPLEAILDVTGLPELEVLQIFDRLVSNGAVVFR